MGKPISLVAGFKDVSRTLKSGRVSKQAAIQIETEGDAWFDPDCKTATAAIAEAIKTTLREALLRGERPDGGAMPLITESTKEQRESLERTFAEGRATRRQQAEFKSRLGTFTPKSGGPRGVLSGLLANSFSVQRNRDGKGFTVYVAAKRGKPDPGDTTSALERVYGGVPIWSQAAMERPAIRAALSKGSESLIVRDLQLLAAGLKAVDEAMQTIEDESEED